jgi:hypothetical protein
LKNHLRTSATSFFTRARKKFAQDLAQSSQFYLLSIDDRGSLDLCAFAAYADSAPITADQQERFVMLAKTRRKLNMGTRVLEFSRKYPDASPGYLAAAARLQGLLDRAEQLARQQNDGRSEVRVATGRKRELRRLMLQAHLDHLAHVAEIASIEEPEVIQKFVFPADATTYQAFQTAASGIAAEAESRKDLLMKHGLSEEVLNGLKVALEQFETAVEQGAAGRLAHVGASAELVIVSEQVVQTVKVMNGLIRIRFGNQREILAAWESASNVIGPPRPQEDTPTDPDGEVRPAA